GAGPTTQRPSRFFDLVAAECGRFRRRAVCSNRLVVLAGSVSYIARAAVLVVITRLEDLELTGRLLEKARAGEDKEGWELIERAAISPSGNASGPPTGRSKK